MGELAENIFNDIVSAAKVALKSGLCPENLKHLRRGDDILIMGNGPSLNDFLEHNRSFLEGKELMAVNFAVVGDKFTDLRPRYYTAIDPAVFDNREMCSRLFGALAAKTAWELELFVPRNVRKKTLWKSLVSQNPLITIHYLNTTSVKGSDAVGNLMFDLRLGMPSPRNVLVPSLMASLWMGYKNIYLAGVEHTWHNQLRVDENNRLMINDTHYFDSSDPGYVRHGNFTIDSLFRSLALAFGSYHRIARYARKKGCRIYNLTENSFIDAFERMKT